jgi:hypothetical protein
MRKYRESLKNTRPVVVPKELHRVRIDYSALVKYVKQKGVEPSRLSDEEKNQFILNSDMQTIKELRNQRT